MANSSIQCLTNWRWKHSGQRCAIMSRTRRKLKGFLRSFWKWQLMPSVLSHRRLHTAASKFGVMIFRTCRHSFEVCHFCRFAQIKFTLFQWYCSLHFTWLSFGMPFCHYMVSSPIFHFFSFSELIQQFWHCQICSTAL